MNINIGIRCSIVVPSTPVKNANNEIEVWISCYCKNSFNKNGYKFYQIEVNDGGNCNILIKINITKERITELAIAGLA